MRKRNVLLISYVAASFLILGGTIYNDRLKLELYDRYVNTAYQHSFSELATGINEIDTALQKSVYSTSASMLASVCTQIYGKAMAAQMSLGELPLSHYDLTDTAGFIARVGDYAYVLSVRAARGEALTADAIDNLRALSEIAGGLSSKITELEARVTDGQLSMEELQSSKNQVEREKAGEPFGPATLGDNFKLIENEFPEIPSLIYDGPFSSHITNSDPAVLRGLEDIGPEDARQIAADFMDTDLDMTEVLSERGGDLPAYLVSVNARCGGITVVVTKRGGAVLSAFGAYSADRANLSAEEAVDIAKKFLAKQGFPEMRDSYWTLSGNVALLNFASEQDGIVCYPDLVKVSVSLDDGCIVAFEATGYVMNHTARNLPEAIISEDEARRKVPEDLSVLSHALAVIPTEGRSELFCHEFKCAAGSGQHLVIYVNAVTGEEERILILLEDEYGTLTL